MRRTQLAEPRVFGPLIDGIVIALTWWGTIHVRQGLRVWWPFDLIPGDVPVLHSLPIGPHLYLGFLVVPVWLLCLRVYATYDDLRTLRKDILAIRVARATLAATLLMAWGVFALQIDQASRTLFVLFPLLCGIAIFLNRLGMIAFMRRKNLDTHNILVIGSGAEAEPFVETLLRHKDWGIKVYGVMRPSETDDLFDSADTDVNSTRIPVLGTLRELPEVLEAHPIHQVFMTGRAWETRTLRRIADSCEELGVEFSMDANFLGLRVAHADLRDFEGWSVLSFTTTPSSGEAMVVKRVIDIIGAGIGLLMLSPLLLLTAALIKLKDRGPIFFGQERSGLYGKTFTMWKFRSMVVNAESLKSELAAQNEMDGPVFKIKHDPRITPIGRFIRKTSIDELPQLWNVLVGDMSLVGPRPPIPAEVAQYERWQLRRLSMRPGITCIWQVSGRNNIDFETWMKLDLQYIDNWSLFLDIKLLLKTIPVVLLRQGAS
jgi:exopolysaccharide biosynthesis polyprenyl glycosylphosphotransferase